MKFSCSVLVHVALSGGLLMTGCERKPKDADKPVPQAPPQTASSAVADNSGIAPVEMPTFGGAEALPLTPGDLAWKELQVSIRSPSVPPEWAIEEPSREALAAFQKTNSELAAAAAERAKEFYTKFPQHEMAAEAREQEYRLLSAAVEMGNTNRAQQLHDLEQARMKDPNLTEDDRFEMRVDQLQRTLSGTNSDDPAVMLTAMEKGVLALQKDFPMRPEIPSMLMSVAEGWLAQNEIGKSRTVAKSIAASDADSETKTTAEDLLKKLDRVGKPLAISFKALDGREVDLQKLKGKVVLVDFWATWCGPCMAELPNVKAAYEKLHDRGFEIIGISFDQDKDKLERVVQREKMSWPQYFEAGDENKFGDEFGISGIPTMWLVDKKGVLRDLNARAKLAEKVEKLLSE